MIVAFSAVPSMKCRTMMSDASSHASSYGGSQLPSGAWLAKSISRRTLPGRSDGGVGVAAIDDEATGAVDDATTAALLLELLNGDGMSTSGSGSEKNVYADAVPTPMTRKARASFQEESFMVRV